MGSVRLCMVGYRLLVPHHAQLATLLVLGSKNEMRCSSTAQAVRGTSQCSFRFYMHCICSPGSNSVMYDLH